MLSMTCSECQLQIFQNGDEEVELGRDAVVHLTACAECRELDREVRLNASALAAMREDVLPVRRARRLPWMVAAAAAVVVAGIGLAFRTTPPVVVAPIVAKVQSVAPASPPPVPQPAPRVRRTRTVKAVPAEPLLVKFLTDDPDVVIYWLIDPVQGEQAL